MISIGILAWNEEDSLAETISSIFRQSLFKNIPASESEIELVCVPNGCSDKTAEVARNHLDVLLREYNYPHLKCRVCELAIPSKVNAWNEYIHNISAPEAEYIFLMDADISLNTDDTLWNMLSALHNNPRAFFSTDLPVKHIYYKERKTLFDRISLAVSQTTAAASAQISCQLYCSRAGFVRRIWIPKGIIVEDGLLKWAAVTDIFRGVAQNDRVVRAEGASHTFQAYTKFTDIIKNQIRQALGHTIYTYLRDYIKNEKQLDGEELLRSNTENNPDWFLDIIKSRSTQASKLWVIFSGALWTRFRRLSNLSFPEKVKKFPAALVGFGMDLVVYSIANWKLKSGRLAGVWKDTRTRAL